MKKKPMKKKPMKKKPKKLDPDDEYICERCTRPHAGPPQRCEHCGMDGLCNQCIGTLDHACDADS